MWSCGSCGNISPKHKGKIFRNSEYHKSFECNKCKNKKTYKLEISFQVEKELTQDQLNNLEGHLLLQINEPYNEDNEPENYNATNTTYKIERVK